jgi:L,D-peptidoglycan transpeptidase YkuD (ErfK/YbiS/YcfS/YnhG family)
VSAYQRGANGWSQVFGPWSSYIGRNGVAPIGAKREGDGRAPSGVFGFDFMFGVDADPGTRYQYRRITGPNIVWDDDSSSANYNEWIDTNTASGGANPEPMDTTPSYLYGVVIGYNDARTPNLGSGIFLHVSHDSPTSGCISLPLGDVVDLLRWLDPAQSPRVAIGTLSSLTGR